MTETIQSNVVEKEPQDIDSLKAKLNEVNKKKEEWFNKKEELNKEIASLIKYLKEANPEIKQKKQKEDELRKRRDECNKKFRESLEESKILSQDRKALLDKYGQISNPISIEKKIEKIEYSIETEALSLDKEKKLMTQIKGLKKVLGETEIVGDYRARMDEISKNILESKEESNKCHTELKKISKENRKQFKEYLLKSKKVNHLKKEQRQAFKNFVTFKTEFTNLTKTLQLKFNESAKQNKSRKKQKKPHQNREYNMQKTIIDNARIIDQKVKEVEKKLKDRKKLTTQDIIAMQGKKD